MHPRCIRGALRNGEVPIQCMVSYACVMTTKGTPGHVIRVDTETWDAYREACQAKGLSRAADLRVYMNREITAHKRRLRDEQAAENITSSD